MQPPRKQFLVGVSGVFKEKEKFLISKFSVVCQCKLQGLSEKEERRVIVCNLSTVALPVLHLCNSLNRGKFRCRCWFSWFSYGAFILGTSSENH